MLTIKLVTQAYGLKTCRHLPEHHIIRLASFIIAKYLVGDTKLDITKGSVR